jgi:hypothetical protein
MATCGVWSAGDFREEGCLGGWFLRGLESQGHTMEQHYPILLEPGQIPKADFILSNGTRYRLKECIEEMKRKKVPVIVYDLGYMRRANARNPDGYYQMGFNRIGWLPPMECPQDRFDKLGMKVVPVVYDESLKTVLVCAQKFGDGQHGMSQSEMVSLMVATCEGFSKRGFKVLFRPHPSSPFEIAGVETASGPMEQELVRSSFMVTYNSTSGVEALLHGKPVIALSDTAHYYGVSSSLSEDGTLTVPTVAELQSYFNRLAYAQWRLCEIEAGIPFKFLFAQIEGKDPFVGGTDWTRLQPDHTVDKPPVAENAGHGETVPDVDNGLAGKEWPDTAGLSWGAIKKVIKEFTGTSPVNKPHLDALRLEWEEKKNVHGQ